METSASRSLSRVSSHVSLSPIMSKYSIFVSAMSSSIFGVSDWSVFGCVCVCQCGVGGGGDGGGGGGGCGGSDGGGGDGGDYGVRECFDGLFMELLLGMGRIPYFLTKRVGIFWSRKAPVLLY